jgi:hypothetical protein
MKRLVPLFALTLLAVACSPATEETRSGTVSLDPAALHALLIEAGDTIIPSDWSTGEPVPDAARAYWYVPPVLNDIRTASDCTALGEVDTWDCTLTLTAPNLEAEEDERRDVSAIYRLQVRVNDDGSLTLIDPAVRWAVQG